MGVGNLGRIHHIPIRCIQAPVPYIVGNGPGEKMGILYDHGQGTAQVILFNVPDVNAVIGDAAAVYFIKTVDQIDDGGLACPGGTHKSDFLSWFGIEADAVQDGLFRRIAEHHLVETHIALKGNQAECLAAVVRVRKDRYPGRDFPGKILGESGALLHFPVPIHSHVAERHAAFIRFLAFIHHIENTFRAGKGCQQEINLLCELVHGHGALAHIDKIGSKGPKVRKPCQCKKSAHACRQGVINIGQGHDGGDRHAGVGEGFGGGCAEGFVAAAEFLIILGFVVKYLFHLLPGNHFLHKSVDAAKVFLLPDKIFLAPPAVKADEQYHKGQEDHDDQRQL